MTHLLEMKKIEIEGYSSEEEQWLPIIKGLDLTLDRGEVVGLIGHRRERVVSQQILVQQGHRSILCSDRQAVIYNYARTFFVRRRSLLSHQPCGN